MKADKTKILIAQTESHNLFFWTSRNEFVVSHKATQTNRYFSDLEIAIFAITDLTARNRSPRNRLEAISSVRSQIEDHQERPWEKCDDADSLWFM